MPTKIIGIANTKFTPKDSDTPITGKTIYTTEPMDPNIRRSLQKIFIRLIKFPELLCCDSFERRAN